MSKPASSRISLANSLREKDSALYSSANLLSLLFRKINEDLTIDAKGWSALMERYLRNPLNLERIPQTSRGRSSERSNLTKGLSVPGMTMTNFLRGLQVISPFAVEWEFVLHYPAPLGDTIRRMVHLTKAELHLEYHNVKFPERLSPLTQAWRSLREQRIPSKNKALWREHFNRYLANPENGVIRVDGPSGSGRRNSERGNLTKALENPDISIKVFTKGIRILAPDSITSTIRLIMREGGRVTEHSVTVITNQLSMLETEDPSTPEE